MTPDQINGVISLYRKGGISCCKVAKIYGVTSRAINYLLKRSGVKVEGDLSIVNRIYSLNQEYFDIIDTEEKAYWLGFLYADGYNNEKINLVCLALQDQDQKHVEKFKIALGYGGPIRVSRVSLRKPNNADMYVVTMRSRNLSQKLAKLGCFQCKSLTLQFPNQDQVPHSLMRHFIRGYFDGDGCFMVNKNYTKKRTLFKKFCASIASSCYFCEGVKKFLALNLGVSCQIRGEKKYKHTTRELRVFNTEKVFVFLDWMYHGSTVYLDRKFNKYVAERLDVNTRRVGRGHKEIQKPQHSVVSGLL